MFGKIPSIWFYFKTINQKIWVPVSTVAPNCMPLLQFHTPFFCFFIGLDGWGWCVWISFLLVKGSDRWISYLGENTWKQLDIFLDCHLCQRVKVQLSCFILQVLSEDSVIIEGREACSRYFYYGVRYDIMMYFRYESYMEGFLGALAAGYIQYVVIITWFSYVG